MPRRRYGRGNACVVPYDHCPFAKWMGRVYLPGCVMRCGAARGERAGAGALPRPPATLFVLMCASRGRQGTSWCLLGPRPLAACSCCPPVPSLFQIQACRLGPVCYCATAPTCACQHNMPALLLHFLAQRQDPGRHIASDLVSAARWLTSRRSKGVGHAACSGTAHRNLVRGLQAEPLHLP